MDELPLRKNIRLKNYDYSQAGYYFITICSKDKKSLFWEVGATCGRQFSLDETVPFMQTAALVVVFNGKWLAPLPFFSG